MGSELIEECPALVPVHDLNSILIVSRNPVQPQTTKQQQSVGFSALKCNMLTCESVHPVRSIKKSIHVTDHIQTVLWHTDVCTRSYGLIDSTFR